MRSATNNYLHNPFQNRFNDPVSQRRDEMQADANVVSLRERIAGLHERRQEMLVISESAGMNVRGHARQSSHLLTAKLTGQIFAGIFSLLIIALVSVVVLKAF